MHLFGVAFVISGILFALFNEQKLLLYFFLTIGGYIALSIVLPGGKNISNRKKIMVASWQDPNEGVIQVRVPVRTEKVEALLKNNDYGIKLTMTHFVIKALGQLIASLPDLNGKLVFGKFYPHDSVDVSCLVDIEGGKDLAMILIKETDKKSVKQIAQFINDKGSKIKTNKGDADHKKRTQSANFLPAFMVGALMQVARFFTNRLGLNVKPLALSRHQFGAGCVTSLGTLGFEDATAPFTGFLDCVILVSANAVHEEPVIEDGKIVIGRVMQCNFVVDHRFVDGGKAKSLVKTFKEIFQNPERFVNTSGQIKPVEKKPETKKQA